MASGSSLFRLRPAARCAVLGGTRIRRMNTCTRCDAQAQDKEEKLARRRPARIILVRHGESWGNVDEKAYESTPDSQMPLTPRGMKQAEEAGKKIRDMIGEEGQVYFYVSPYKRALQTLLCLGKTIDKDRVAGVREEPRLREQDFGNFQSDRLMKESKKERIRFGRFFFRFPEGESASDVYDRITGFRETLRNDMEMGRFEVPGKDRSNVSVVIVSHGLTLRIFLMRWFKWSVAQFDRLRNLHNCELMVMERGAKGRYSLTLRHDNAALREFGFDDDMILDQTWATEAAAGELNSNWPTSGNCFFEKMAYLIGDDHVVGRQHGHEKEDKGVAEPVAAAASAEGGQDELVAGGKRQASD